MLCNPARPPGLRAKFFRFPVPMRRAAAVKPVQFNFATRLKMKIPHLLLAAALAAPAFVQAGELKGTGEPLVK